MRNKPTYKDKCAWTIRGIYCENNLGEKSYHYPIFRGRRKKEFSLEDFNKAQEYFAQALDISPEDEVAAYNVGEVLFSHQKVDEAIKYFELSIQIKKEWSKPYLKLGYVYLNKGDFDKSLEYFNKFIEMDPENPEAPNVRNIIATIEKMKQD